MEKPLLEIIDAINPIEAKGPINAKIASLCSDSRKAEPGCLFFALPGFHEDGAAFIPHAIKSGAVAVVFSGSLSEYAPGVCYLRVENARAAMSAASAAFYGWPSKRLAVIGVTGTEGKSSVVSFTFQLLRLAGKKAGFISTVNYSLGGEVLKNPMHQTTPDSPDIHKMLSLMADAGAEYAVIEASSHGLSARTSRLADVLFDVGVMTCVTHEHLEFHKTREQYKSDKANLFRALDAHSHVKAGKEVPAFGVVNEDDPSAGYFHNATSCPVYGCSCIASVPRGGLSATGILEAADGISFYISTAAGDSYKIDSPLRGAFNARNIMQAIIVVGHLIGFPPLETLVPLVPKLKPVPGRMTRIDKGQPFEVIVDYAHTPSSFLAIFPPLRGRVTGKLIAVFGSAGERDTLKRPEQGRIASDYCDIIILADEDPRAEDSLKILKDIAEGCAYKTEGDDLLLIPDRKAAIRKAFSLAGAGDLVILLGKGHENSIIYKDESIPYDEIEEAEKALAEAGFK